MNRWLWVSIAALWGAAAVAGQGTWKVGTGADYSVGDYGDVKDTKILFIPVTGSYAWFPWTAKVMVPYVRIEGPGSVIPGTDGGVVADVDAVEVTTESGAGDVVGTLLYTLEPSSEGGPYLDLGAKVKLPTADEDKGLGTGEPDYSLLAEISRAFDDTTPFLSVGYQFMGSSADLNLDDRAFASVGVDQRLEEAVSVGIAYDWKQAASSGSDDVSEASGYVNWKFAEGWSANVYGVTGFSDGSPDWGLGTQVSRRF